MRRASALLLVLAGCGGGGRPGRHRGLPRSSGLRAARLAGSITIAFRDLPCEQAVAQVILPRGDGWRPGGAAEDSPGGPGHWNDSACVRACQDRYRVCTDAC